MKIDIEEVEMALDMHYQTEIVSVEPMLHEPGDNLTRIRCRGGAAARGGLQYVRPMFEVMPAAAGAPFPVQQVPCALCGDFSRSWNCEAHTYWSPVGDEDDLTVVPRGVRRMLANGDGVAAWLLGIPEDPHGFGMPDSFLIGLRSTDLVQASLHTIIEQFGLDDDD